MSFLRRNVALFFIRVPTLNYFEFNLKHLREIFSYFARTLLRESVNLRNNIRNLNGHPDKHRSLIYEAPQIPPLKQKNYLFIKFFIGRMQISNQIFTPLQIANMKCFKIKFMLNDSSIDQRAWPRRANLSCAQTATDLAIGCVWSRGNPLIPTGRVYWIWSGHCWDILEHPRVYVNFVAQIKNSKNFRWSWTADGG